MVFLWVCTILGTCVGAFLLVAAFVTARSAAQEAALAAMGIGCAVIPYIFTRAFDGIKADAWRAAVLKALAPPAALAPAPPLDIMAAQARLQEAGVKFTSLGGWAWRIERPGGQSVETTTQQDFDRVVAELDEELRAAGEV